MVLCSADLLARHPYSYSAIYGWGREGSLFYSGLMGHPQSELVVRMLDEFYLIYPKAKRDSDGDQKPPERINVNTPIPRMNNNNISL